MAFGDDEWWESHGVTENGGLVGSCVVWGCLSVDDGGYCDGYLGRGGGSTVPPWPTWGGSGCGKRDILSCVIIIVLGLCPVDGLRRFLVQGDERDGEGKWKDGEGKWEDGEGKWKDGGVVESVGWARLPWPPPPWVVSRRWLVTEGQGLR